jgi:hypothetical protein
MNSRELRIGNLLRDNISKTELEVIELTNEDIKTYVIVRSKFPLKDGWEIEPIPLTEEWLLRFGFERSECGKICVKKYYLNRVPEKEYSIELMIFSDHISCWVSSLELESNYVEEIMTKPIHYLHQLQNLYFALTGEELTIKTDANN